MKHSKERIGKRRKKAVHCGKSKRVHVPEYTVQLALHDCSGATAIASKQTPTPESASFFKFSAKAPLSRPAAKAMLSDAVRVMRYHTPPKARPNKRKVKTSTERIRGRRSFSHKNNTVLRERQANTKAAANGNTAKNR